MNLIYSNRFFVLFVAVALLQLLGPVYNLVFSFREIPLASYANILSQPVEIKLIIKKLATSGVLVLLLFFSFVYLYVIFISTQKLKLFIWGAFVLIGVGGLGYYFNNQKKLDFRESNHKFISVNFAQGRVVVSINFKEFPEAFYKDLKDAETGNVKLYLNQRFCFPSTDGRTSTFLNKREIPFATKMLLEKSEISHFINDKKLSFELQGDVASLELRDLNGGPLKSREDSLQVAGKKIELDYDKAFFLSFYVESLDGKVLRVYL